MENSNTLPRCQGHKANGSQCTRPLKQGRHFCRTHAKEQYKDSFQPRSHTKVSGACLYNTLSHKKNKSQLDGTFTWQPSNSSLSLFSDAGERLETTRSGKPRIGVKLVLDHHELEVIDDETFEDGTTTADSDGVSYLQDSVGASL